MKKKQNNNKEHLVDGNHKDSLKCDIKTYNPLSFSADGLTKKTKINSENKGKKLKRIQQLLDKKGALIEGYDNQTDSYQPIGHVAPLDFRVFPDINYPDRRDLKLTRKLRFGLKPSLYRYEESTVGLELEHIYYSKEGQLVEKPLMEDDAYIHPTIEFFKQMGEVGTDPQKGGIYTDVEEGLEIHKKVNSYLVDIANKTGKYACVLGTFPLGKIKGTDVSIDNEYLRRISIWLSSRVNYSQKEIYFENLKNEIASLDINLGNISEQKLHQITSLYNVAAFQPMIAIPHMDGDLCIEAVNFLNGPIILALMGATSTSPFWRDEYTGYRSFRSELRHLFITGLRIPPISKWFEGTKERVINHLISGEGINIGRAMLSDDIICYSNSLFRIRPGIGAIEIAGLDSHPIPEVRVAVAEVLKLLIHYVSTRLVKGEKDKLFKLIISGSLNEYDYYASYHSVAKLGNKGFIYKDNKKYSVKKTLDIIMDVLEGYVLEEKIMSLSKFKEYVRNPIMSQYKGGIPNLTFYDIFRNARKKSGTIPNISDHLVLAYENSGSVHNTVMRFLKDYYSYY